MAATLALPAHAAAQGACQTVETARPAKRGSGMYRPPLAIGDSSMLLGVRALAARGFDAYARGCLQMSPAVSLIAARRRAGTLPRLVVLALGNNGQATQGEISRALRVLGPRRRLALVTPGGHSGSAAAFRAAARRHRSRVVLVDWAASGIPARFGGDRIHIGEQGETAEAAFIRRRVRQFFPPPRRLRVPASARGLPACGLTRGLRLFVARGSERIGCDRVKEIARVRATPRGWRSYPWRVVGRPPFTHVWARADLRVVIAARPPVR